MSDDFQGEPASLGIAHPPVFVHAPDGNGCSERFIRTLNISLFV